MTPTRQVVLALTASGILFATANGLQYANDEAGRRIANPLPRLGGWEMLIAWGALTTFLVLASELPSTGDLAVAFAFLILLTMLFTYGVSAFQNLVALMGDREKQTGGGGGGSKTEIR